MTRHAGVRKGSAAVTYVALLRGINVAGKNKLPMQELIPLFEGAGCSGVRTYIQSGNVVFESPVAHIATVPDRVSAEIARRFGFRTPIVLRSAAEMAALPQRNPFVAAGVDEDHLHVALLSRVPDPHQAAALDPERSPPDEFAIDGRDVFLRMPNGMGRTKLTNAYLDSTLGTISTVRNWRTVLKLIELAQAAP